MRKTAPQRVTAYIALGANLGATLEANAQAVRDAIQAIHALPHVQVTQQSSLYQTAAMESLPDAPKSPDYINAVIEVSCTQPAQWLLEQLQKIEQSAGRERPYKNAPRTLDLDILLFGDEKITTDTLTVPHPRMWQRAFVLLPLAEIAPQLVSAQSLQAVKGQDVTPLSWSTISAQSESCEIASRRKAALGWRQGGVG
ncbi:MAG: 2-amino-4-hydroxy-6-hydroxymethyldihydropteridine diphosphokinase [Polaromonas sp.]|nr:2-amino-4-hydroxy-6-hydroxymethyldihydropteridine diphosphokinase [Polaromonas sp.]